MNLQKLPDESADSLTTRREFLRTSGKAVAGAALAGAVARPGYTAESNTLKIALVGCGGRGTGAAAQALSTKGPTMLWAMADVFEDRLKGSLDQRDELIELDARRYMRISVVTAIDIDRSA